MPSLPSRPRRRRDDDPLARTDAWFLANGLSYFVPEKRREAKAALSPRRTVPRLLAVALLAAAGGTALAYLTKQVSAAPAVVLTIVLLSMAWYALTVLHARPILTWSLKRTVASLPLLLPLMTRVLPLLLVFVTFLFINAEVWQLSASLDTGTLWLVAMLFAGLAGAFLVSRLPEEVDRIDDAVDARFLRRACRGTPLEQSCADLLADDDPAADPTSRATVGGFERANLIGFLAIVQFVQVFLMAAGVFVFFLLFGALTMRLQVQEAWTGIDRSDIHAVPHLSQISVPLFQVSLFLGAFSMLYLTVSTITDETYREQFFGLVHRELERAVGVRAVYLTLRERRGKAADPESSPPSA
ncbi:hypothetical protein [Nocardioides acrostichi]|uniref:Integral membrane protein n=1 Tax=Nocardioides acrostichi TaxID=2784339 RepID=A0A930UY29_9ACTN|nr:hypothetical protein [Nocardioides acrostichi]MBF4160514.1 hypothetical protein [Nocardioides acrostichi]